MTYPTTPTWPAWSPGWWKRFGTIDVVVNAAAVQIYPPKSITEMEPGEWDFVLDICLKAAYLSTRHVAPVMKRQGGGKIVNIASIAGHRGIAGGAAYSAAKGGVVMLTRQMAVELGRDNINVNSVSPGFTPNRLTTIYEYEALTKGEGPGPEPSITAGEFTPPALDAKARSKTSSAPCYSWPPAGPTTSPARICRWREGGWRRGKGRPRPNRHSKESPSLTWSFQGQPGLTKVGRRDRGRTTEPVIRA